MTPTEQDKELREKVEKQFDDFIKELRVNTPDGWERKKYIDLDEALQLIAADKKRVALEARIEGKLDFIKENYPDLDTDSKNQNYNQINWIVREVRDSLLAELKAQQEEV